VDTTAKPVPAPRGFLLPGAVAVTALLVLVAAWHRGAPVPVPTVRPASAVASVPAADTLGERCRALESEMIEIARRAHAVQARGVGADLTRAAAWTPEVEPARRGVE